MNYRMSDQDCAFARNEAITGMVATQMTWLLRPPGEPQWITSLLRGAQRGRLGRVAAPAILGPAGDRWSRQPPSRRSTSSRTPSLATI